MTAVWNIARLVFLEAHRRRFLFFLLICFIVILLVPIVLPAEGPEKRIRLAQSWSLTGITLFGLVLTLFLGSISLPRDIQSGRANLLVAKPVNRFQILSGKFLGIAAVLLLFTAVTGFLGVVLIRGITLMSDDGKSRRTIPAAYDKMKAEKFRFYQESADSGVVYRGQTITKDGKTSMEIRGRNTTNVLAEWEFSLPPNTQYSTPPTIRGKFNGRGPERRFSFKVRFLITAPVVVKKEGRNRNQEIRWVEQQRVLKPLSQNRPFSFRLDRDILKNFGRIRVRIAAVNPATELRFTRSSIHLSGPPGNFELNYLKALFLLFLLFLLVNSLLIAITPVLSTPIALFVGTVFYLVSAIRPFLVESLETTRSAIQTYGGAGSPGPHTPTQQFPLWLLQYSEFITGVTVSMVPDIGLFNQSSRIVKDLVIPGHQMGAAMGEAGIYLVIFFIAGTFLFRLRDLS